MFFLLKLVLSDLFQVLVNEVDSQTISSPLELGHQIAQLLDVLNLLLEVLSLKEVTHLGVRVVLSNLVKVQQALEKGKQE